MLDGFLFSDSRWVFWMNLCACVRRPECISSRRRFPAACTKVPPPSLTLHYTVPPTTLPLGWKLVFVFCTSHPEVVFISSKVSCLHSRHVGSPAGAGKQTDDQSWTEGAYRMSSRVVRMIIQMREERKLWTVALFK